MYTCARSPAAGRGTGEPRSRSFPGTCASDRNRHQAGGAAGSDDASESGLHRARGKQGTRVYMYEFFHYLKIFSFVPTLFPLCSHFVPTCDRPVTRMNPWFLGFVPTVPTVFRGIVPKEIQKPTAAPMKKGPCGPCGLVLACARLVAVPAFCTRFGSRSGHAARWGIFTTLPALRPSR